MSFLHGKATQMILEGEDVSSYFTGVDLGAEVDTADITTFQKDWKVYLEGLASGSIEGTGLYDPGLVAVKDTLQAPSSQLLMVAPGKWSTLGDPARLIQLISSAYKESAPVGDVVAFQWTGQTDEPIGWGRMIHPLGAETSTGTSTYLDGGASSSNGAIAHCHVTAISGTGSPSVTIEFSDATTSGGTYTPITGGTMTLQDAVGAQRLVIPGTIRRYVKATWTIAGTGPSVSFAVALART